MRHGDKINNLSRTPAHRKAMLANMANALIKHKRITTTTAKAKALRVYVEPLITKAKTDTTQNRRAVFRKLQDKAMITELFNNVGVKVADRPGGYTRIIKLAPRIGDAADVAMIELVDYNTTYVQGRQAAEGKKTRRSRRGGAKKATAGAAEATNQETAGATTVEEQPQVASVPTDAPTEEPKTDEPKVEEPTPEQPAVEEPKASSEETNTTDTEKKEENPE